MNDDGEVGELVKMGNGWEKDGRGCRDGEQAA